MTFEVGFDANFYSKLKKQAMHNYNDNCVVEAPVNYELTVAENSDR
jgi:hypothetical protein